MAKLTLSDYECDRDLIPPICMFCGLPATTRITKKFAWHPSWVWVFVLITWILALILALILTKKMTIRVPVCEKHDGWWRRRSWTLALSFFALVASAVAMFVIAVQVQPQGDLTGWICGGTVLLLLVWLVGAAIYSAQAPRPYKITDHEIMLNGVHPNFVAEVNEERRRDRDGDDYRERRRGPLPLDDTPHPEEDYDDDLERRARE